MLNYFFNWCSLIRLHSWKSLACRQRQERRVDTTHFSMTLRIQSFILASQHITLNRWLACVITNSWYLATAPLFPWMLSGWEYLAVLRLWREGWEFCWHPRIDLMEYSLKRRALAMHALDEKQDMQRWACA